jgi:hypothetical protein
VPSVRALRVLRLSASCAPSPASTARQCTFRGSITATITSYFISQETPSRDVGDRVVERLPRLAELRRERSLTEEEFAAATSRAIAWQQLVSSDLFTAPRPSQP